jgi:hypothetical protein
MRRFLQREWSRAYVPQVPWMTLDTVRQNIMFRKTLGTVRQNMEFESGTVKLCMLVPWNMTSSSCRMVTSLGLVNVVEICLEATHCPGIGVYRRTILCVLDSPLSAIDIYNCQHLSKIACIIRQWRQWSIGHSSDWTLSIVEQLLVVMQDGKQVFCDEYECSIP